MLERVSLRLRFAAFFAALGLGGAAAFAGALWLGWSRSGGPADGFILAFIAGGFAIIGLATGIGFLFDENVARPVVRLSEDLRTRAASDVEAQIDEAPGRYLGSLAPAAAAIHDALASARREQAQIVAESTARIEREKALLEALVRDLSQAVIVISTDQRVMLFNRAAEDLLGPLGLDRRLARYLTLDPLNPILGGARTDRRGPAHFLTSNRTGERLLKGTAAEFGVSEALGHVLVFEDATAALRSQASDRLRINRLVDQTRRQAMNVGVLVDVLEVSAEDNAQRAIYVERIRAELGSLADELSATESERDSRTAEAWPMQAGPLADVVSDIAPATLTAGTDVSATVHCDTYFFERLCRRLTDLVASERRALAWSAEAADGDMVQLSLGWDGPALPQTEVEALLESCMLDAYRGFTVRDALDAHRSDLWLDGPGQLSLLLPRHEMASTRPIAPRSQFYDFTQVEDGSQALSDLPFVVFDTETTGLDPQRDEVVQIAGVRILRGRIVSGDDFDQFVDPGRPIPESSSRIHGISDAMVAGAPDWPAARDAFLEFTDNAVLIAHHAAFDMAFLNRPPKAAGDDRPTPVLCTAQLSLGLNPHLDDHTLDGLAERLGVEIDDELRHTALGDAKATAEVFLKMVPILAARGVVTLSDALRFQKLP